MNLRRVTINLEVGQDIFIGQHNDRATITKMEYHRHSGEITINTTKGPYKALNFKLSNDMDASTNPADKYRWENKMRIKEILEGIDLDEKASRKLCLSTKRDSELGASNLASCKSQGLRARDGKKSHKIGDKRVTVGGKKIKGKKYGGKIPDYGSHWYLKENV